MHAISDLFDPATVDDPYPFYAELRRHTPVYRVPGTDFFLVSTWDAVQEATARAEDFSSNLTAALVHQGGTTTVFDMDTAGSAGHVLATADDPHHADHRRLVLPGLVAKRIRALEPFIERTARQLWTDAAPESGMEWMSAMGDRLPMTLVAKLIGLPDEDVPRLVERGYGSTELLGGVCWPRDGCPSPWTPRCNWPATCTAPSKRPDVHPATTCSATSPSRSTTATSSPTSRC